MAGDRTDTPVEGDVPQKRRAVDTIAAASYVLRNRDRLVREVVDGLKGAGVLDRSTADRILMLYQASDSRTRLALQALVARVVRVPLERWDTELAEEDVQLDLDKISEADLDRLKDIALPKVDPRAVSNRIRSIDVDAIMSDQVDDDHVSAPVRFLGDIPVFGHKIKSRLRIAGVILLLLAAAALAFPAYAQQILFYGLIALIALTAALLLRLSWKVEKVFQRYEIDVDALAKLTPPERRLLMVRRAVLIVFDPERLADIWERVAHAVLPEALLHDPTHPHRLEEQDDRLKQATQDAKAAEKAAKARTKAAEEVSDEQERALKAQERAAKQRGKVAKAREKAAKAEERARVATAKADMTPPTDGKAETKPRVKARVRKRPHEGA